MIIGCCFICAFLVLINKVCLQVTVEGFIGGSVVLPCSSAERDLKLQDINVLWRDEGSETVYDIIKGKASVERQDPQYKNRAETFPEEYERGNFSLRLINLNYTDAGEFSCFITHSSDSKQDNVRLFINDSTAEKDPGTQSDWKKILLICVCTIFIILVSVIACIIIRRKRALASYIGGTVAN